MKSFNLAILVTSLVAIPQFNNLTPDQSQNEIEPPLNNDILKHRTTEVFLTEEDPYCWNNDSGYRYCASTGSSASKSQKSEIINPNNSPNAEFNPDLVHPEVGFELEKTDIDLFDNSDQLWKDKIDTMMLPLTGDPENKNDVNTREPFILENVQLKPNLVPENNVVSIEETQSNHYQSSENEVEVEKKKSYPSSCWKMANSQIACTEDYVFYSDSLRHLES
jgi:hypothetical protein